MKAIKRKSPSALGGRPVTVGGDKYVGLRLPSALLDIIDTYADANVLKRSEAIRYLIELGITNTALEDVIDVCAKANGVKRSEAIRYLVELGANAAKAKRAKVTQAPRGSKKGGAK